MSEKKTTSKQNLENKEKESDSNSDSSLSEKSDSNSDSSLKKIKVASLFCGCGGLDYFFHKNEKFEVVYSNDIDKVVYLTKEFHDKTPEGEVLDELKMKKMYI